MTQFETINNLYKKPLAIIVFIALMALCYFFVDQPVAVYFHQMDLRTNMPVLNWITLLGQWKIYVPLFVVLALYFQFLAKNKVAAKKTWFLFACVIGATMIEFVLKVALGRARPDLLFDSSIYGFFWLQLKNTYWSMPSGHATAITAVVSGLGVLFPRVFYPLLLLVVLIMATRVLLTYHYVSDVFVGYYSTVVTVGFIASFFKSKIF